MAWGRKKGLTRKDKGFTVQRPSLRAPVGANCVWMVPLYEGAMEGSGLVESLLGRLPPKRGGRVPRRVRWEVVRSLRVPDDLPLLLERTPVPGGVPVLKQIRHSHHQLARLLATGTDIAEAALITGYNPSYISKIKTDPSFCSLLEYYHEQREQLFVDVVERMRTLGLSTLDELQNRLEEEPDEWSRRELMEMAELMLVKPAAARTNLNVTAPAPQVAVNVRFVTAHHEEPLQIEGKVIDQ